MNIKSPLVSNFHGSLIFLKSNRVINILDYEVFGFQISKAADKESKEFSFCAE